MNMVFHFKALSPEDDKFERDYEISYESTLLELHNYIIKDLGFDKNEMASFFMSDSIWSKLQEFTSEDMFYGENESDIEELTPLCMGDVTLGKIIQQKHERLLYVFDLLSNRGLYLELIKSIEGEDKSIYPRTTASVGEAPIQLVEDDVGDEVSEMFDDMYDNEEDFSEFEDYDSKEYY